MTDWREFWDKYPKRASESDFLKQVGKTVGGVPISEEQFIAIINSIERNLVLRDDDRVLDLCCGNGIITEEIAKKCKFVLGIDFSESLIAIAQKNNRCPNARFLHMDVRSIEDLPSEYNGYFNKVLCYEALAFFNERDFQTLLKSILRVSKDDVIIVFGSVLDRERIWNFFDTVSRKLKYLFQIKLLKREVGLGRWWTRRELETICRNNDLTLKIVYQDEILHTSHYRFDLKIRRK